MLASALTAREPDGFFHDCSGEYSGSGGDLARLALKFDIGAASESPVSPRTQTAGLPLGCLGRRSSIGLLAGPLNNRRGGVRKIKGRSGAMFYSVSPQSAAPAAKEDVRPEPCVLCSAAQISLIPDLSRGNHPLGRNVREPERASGAASSRKVGQSGRVRVAGPQPGPPKLTQTASLLQIELACWVCAVLA